MKETSHHATTEKPLRVGVIGLGNMGKNHVRVLSTLRNADLAFVYDSDSRLTSEIANTYGTIASTDVETDLARADAIVIVTPTSTHLEWIRRVASRVKHVFVEKPLGTNYEESKAIYDIVTEHETNLQVGFIERYNPTIVGLRQVLMENRQRVINIDFVRTNKLSKRITDVDVVVDLMIHDIDLARYLNGPVSDVSAYGVMENGMVAYAACVLEHENGVYSRLTASRITEKRIRQITVTCDDMYLDCDLLRKEILINKQTVQQAYKGVSLSSTMEAVQLSNQEPLLSEHIDFVFRSVGAIAPTLSVGIPGVEAGLEAARIADEVKKQIMEKK